MSKILTTETNKPVKQSLAPAVNQTRFFETEHLKADLKGRSVKGGSITIVAQIVKLFLQIGSSVFLARLLTPNDFGLIAMVAVLTSFVLIFKDMGLSMATVQRAEINHGQISTLFWVNVAFSLMIMLITVALAPVVALFYGEPRLKWITIALACGLLFGGLAVQHQALLKRQMRFACLAAINVISMFIGVFVAILAAWFGMGYWALVVLQLATAFSTAVGVWIMCGWRPGLPVRNSGVRKMLFFGANMVGFSIINYFARNMDNMLIGWRWGVQPLGLYSRAYAFLLLPIGQFTTPITSVAVPALSRLQNEPERYRNYYLKAIQVIAYVSMPFIVSMAVLSPEIIGLVLGKQWLSAAPIFRILAFAAIWQPVGSTVGWIYVSLGQTRRMMIWGFIGCPIIVLSFLIGLPWGVKGVASCYALCMWLLVYPSFSFALKHSPLRAGAVFLNIYHPLAISIVMGLAMTIARTYVIDLGLLWRIAIPSVVGCITLLLLACGFRSVRTDVFDIVKTAKLVFAKSDYLTA